MSATAAAPGSVTTVFVPQNGDASLGVSFATADGVTATVERAAEPRVVLDGQPAEVEPVTGVLRRLNAAARVRLSTDIPIGCGFGVSGAATLATALAVNAEQQLGHDREALVQAAHRAEVEAGTGLGDVFIQDRGGLVWDLGDGLRHTKRSARVEYVSFGEMATAAVLGNEGAMERVEDVGRAALGTLDPTGPLTELFEASWRFADRVGLATASVSAAVTEVRDADGAATMAMVGETVVATDVDGVLPHATRIAAQGARVQ